MYGLDLFSGIGGITKALEQYVRPVAYCEIDPYARGVLLSRMVTGDLPVAPVWDDVTTLRGANLPHVDIIYGGFPCQDISVAGRGAGLGGERSGLFFEIVRLAGETGAPFIFLENVPNIRTKGLGRVIKELDKFGYDCRWGLLSAADVGASHKRDRWFLLAHLEHCGMEVRRGTSPVGAENNGPARVCQPNESCDYNQTKKVLVGGSTEGEWLPEPRVGRVANGVPQRVDRLRALGNAVVPAQVKKAFESLMGAV